MTTAAKVAPPSAVGSWFTFFMNDSETSNMRLQEGPGRAPEAPAGGTEPSPRHSVVSCAPSPGQLSLAYRLNTVAR